MWLGGGTTLLKENHECLSQFSNNKNDKFSIIYYLNSIVEVFCKYRLRLA